jgi:hypothetical protein
MEQTLLRAIEAQLKAYPPLSALDVIRAAKLVTQGCHVDTPTLVHILTLLARDPNDLLPPDVLKKLRTLLMNDLVEDILDEIRVLSPAADRCCCWP